MGEDTAQDGADQVVDGIGCLVVQGRALAHGGPTGAGAAVSTQAGSGAQAHARTEGLFGHRLCAAHGHTVEGLAA